MRRLRAVLLPHLKRSSVHQVEGLEWPELLTEPTDGTQGDLALPCFIFARALRQAPASIAEAFAQAPRWNASHQMCSNPFKPATAISMSVHPRSDRIERAYECQGTR